MKITALFIAVLLVAMLVIPAAAAGAEPIVSNETIIHGVTLKPTEEPTKVPTTVPTKVPTTEIIKPVTTLHIVTEPTRAPVTQETTHVITAVPTKEPGPQVGWLTILSSPSGAEVLIDGNPAGVTPINGRELGAGSHAIKITMTGYEPYTAEKVLSAGEQAAIDATLKQVPITTVPTTHPTVAPTTHVTTVPTSIPTTRPTSAPTSLPTTACVGCDKGWLRMNCNVNGAAVSYDSSSPVCTIAQGFCDTEVGTTSTPYTTFTVSKSGYQTFAGPVTSWPANGQTVPLYATLNPNPTPSYGNVYVTSSPSGAVATIDGGTWQYTPATFSSVSAGTSHNVQVTMSGYQSYGSSVYVTAGQTSSVTAYLTPNTPQTGSLNIRTSPEGADIYVDGHYQAESPYVVSNLAPGSHTLRLHKAGYDEYLSTVTVYAGQQSPITITFTHQQPNMGSIEVGSTPGGSSVYLDGNYMGQTPVNSFTDLTSIPDGSHTILIQHTDYQDYTQTVYVQGGGVVTVNAQLSPNAPSPIPDTTGQIIIVSTPAGAELFLDNTFRGVTPVTLSDIPQGSHVVTVKQAGYIDASQTVTVTGGQSTPVAISLAAIPTTTKAPLTVVPGLAAFGITGIIFALGRRKE
jgi:hypothetical protein